METVVILTEGILKKCVESGPEQMRKICNPKFNHSSGFLSRFRLNGVDYVHVKFLDFKEGDRTSTKIADPGYYQADKFLEYRKGIHKATQMAKFKLKSAEADDGVLGDRIWIRKLSTVDLGERFCQVVDIYWEYVGDKILDEKSDINIGPDKDINKNYLEVDPVAEGFHKRNIELVKSNNFPIDDRETGAYLIAKIALQIDRVIKDIFPKFQKDTVFDLYIESQKYEWKWADIFDDPSIEDFGLYLRDITAFYETVNSNMSFIEGTTTKNKLYWLAHSISEIGLRVVPVAEKIEILRLIVEGVVLGGTSLVVPKTVNEEDFANKILRSVAPDQEDSFLTALQEEEYIDAQGKRQLHQDALGENITLFTSLYNKINDAAGTDNLRTFVETLYVIWLRSSFYPLNFDGTGKDDRINPTIYGNNPIVISYESDTILGLFDTTNYDFWFNGTRIEIVEPKIEGSRNYFKRIGSYGCYQAVTVKSVDLNSNDTRFISVMANNAPHYVLPIFYLKYIDDNKETTNLENALQLGTDLALLLAGGGLGNLKYLMHLKNINRLGLAVIRSEELAAEFIVMRYQLAQGITTAIQLTGKVATIFNNYVSQYKDVYCHGPQLNLEKCRFHTKLGNIFTMLQLFGEVLDPVFSRNLIKTSKDLLNGELPGDFPDELFELLSKFAVNADDVTEDFLRKLELLFGPNSHISQRIDNAGKPGEISIVERDELVVDFHRATDSDLSLLNANSGDLINYWRMVKSPSFMRHRKSVEYLRNLKIIKRASELHIEVFIGSFKKIVNPNNPNDTPSWYAKGVHHKNALDSHKGGIARIVKGTQSVPDALGYYTAIVEMYHPEFPNGAPNNAGWKRKNKNGGVSSFYRDDWEVPRVQEELAFAYMSKTYQVGDRHYVGRTSDATKNIIYIENGVITSMYPEI